MEEGVSTKTNMNRQLLHTPEGVRDIYGKEYAAKLGVEEVIRRQFNLYGYQDIQTPTFEFFDVFSREIGTTPSRELYKFFDKEGNTLALRPDFTPSMARCAAKYFMEEDIPIRFCYLGNTFTNTSSLQGKLKEVTQMGAELIGDDSVEADAELIAMLIAASAIGGASIVFQSIINNTIVTPCLLGMNSLYTLTHTAVVFAAGSGSILAANANAAFATDLVLMGITATVLYSYLFRKTNHNVLYVLLVGTVLTSFFGSIQSAMIRTMDPNEYDSLLSTLVASFSNINSEIILFTVIVLAAVVFALRKELALLDVITLGREQAINLGVDYDRTIRRLLLGVTLCIAAATAMVGPISFLGLIIANLARQFLKTYRHSFLITGSSLFGMLVLVGGQLAVEHVFSYAIPVSVFITAGGGIYFLYLLLRKEK